MRIGRDRKTWYIYQIKVQECLVIKQEEIHESRFSGMRMEESGDRLCYGDKGVKRERDVCKKKKE